MGKGRNTDGRFTPEHTDAEILAAVRAHEPAATSEVAGELDMTRQGVDRRLRLLRDDGQVNSKKIAASLVWFAPEQDRREPTDAPRAAGVADATDGPADPPADAHGAEESDAPDPLADALDGWDPDTETPVETAHAETRRAAEWLRERGIRHKRSAFVGALADESSLSGRVWWERAVRPGLRRLADAGLVEYRAGYHDYRWIGPDGRSQQK